MISQKMKSRMTRYLPVRSALLTLFTVGFLTGCQNPIYVLVGGVLKEYSENEATPYVLQMDDFEMACAMGESLHPLVYSFSRVVPAPDDTSSLLMLSAANCAESQAWEAELSSLRAEYNGQLVLAKDERERAKRLNALVAERRLIVFNHANSAYDYDPSDADAECPRLIDDQDELTFMLGLLTGLQGITNDANSGMRAGIPRDIGSQAEKGMRCLNNEKWGGLPESVRALVWMLIPDTRPADSMDPWLLLEKNSELGAKAGYRASGVVELMAADMLGKDEIFKDALQRFAEAGDTMTRSEDYALVDETAFRLALFLSDKHWVSEYGYRTPEQYFGRLSTQTEDVDTMSLDGLL